MEGEAKARPFDHDIARLGLRGELAQQGEHRRGLGV
jgi:hypothetical protein